MITCKFSFSFNLVEKNLFTVKNKFKCRNRNLHHRQSTDTPRRINGQRIGRVSPAISADYRQISRSICRPSLGRFTSVNMSTDTTRSTYRPICRSTYRPILDRYVYRYIGRGVHKIHMIQFNLISSAIFV